MSSARLSPDAPIGAFALDRHRYVYLVGGGGKTSLMFAMAEALQSRGHSAVTTTSTKIRYPDSMPPDDVIIDDDPNTLAETMRHRSAGPRHTTIGKTLLDGGAKIGGFSAEELDDLYSAKIADHYFVEGDGSAGRSLKAHMDHEPVVSDRADLVIAVVGIDCVGMPLTDTHVHRADQVRSLLGREGAAQITVDDVARIILHPLGYLARVNPRSAVTVFISKANHPRGRDTARCLAQTLFAADTHGRICQIVIGEICRPPVFIEICKLPLDRGSV